MQSPQQAPIQHLGLGSGLGSSQSGAGHDFVLFDDGEPNTSIIPGTAVHNYPTTSSNLTAPSSLAGAMLSSQPFHDSMPAFARNKPSFTQYRGPHWPTAAGGDGAAAESPFSSPASKLDDDFGTAGGAPSSLESSGSGTLSSATGVPNRKRQRNNDGRGQGSTSSLTGLPTAMGASQSHGGTPGARAASRLQNHRHSLGGEPPSSVPGLLDSTSTYPSAGDDWSLADTSPQNPPSGSFGPPIGSLSLAGDGSGTGDDYLPLFSDFSPSQQAGEKPEAQDFTSLFGLSNFHAQPGVAGGAPPFDTNSIENPLLNIPPTRNEPTAEQEATARRQVRQDLAAVDQRALRGPLRDLAQSNEGVDPSSSADSKVTAAQLDAALKAAVQDFVSAAQGNRQRLGQSRAPGMGTGSADAMGAAPANISQAQQRSLLFPGSVNEMSADGFAPVPENANGAFPQRPSPGPRKRSSSFDASFLPASQPWFNQSPPQQSLVTDMGMDSSRVEPGKPGGVGMGTGTGWYGQPTNSFNAFDLSGSGAVDPGKARRRPLTRDRSGLTCSPHETFLDPNEGGLGAASMWLNGMNLFPGAADSQNFIEQAIRNATRDTSNVATPKSQVPPAWPTKPAMTREDTIRPAHRLTINPPPGGVNDHGQTSKRAHPASSSSASSGMSLYSPGGSDTTPSTDDDLDEKPYKSWQSALLNNGAGGGIPGQPSMSGPAAANPSLMPPRSHLFANAPRFLASSTSSSEDEDEANLPFNSSRGFAALAPGLVNQNRGPINFGPAAQGGIRNTQPNPQQGPAGPQPLARGRGLQGGYGHMPGSAESGLQIDVSQPGTAMKTTAVDTTMAAGDLSELLNQTREDGSLSPSIRSAAQVIEPRNQSQLPWPMPGQQLPDSKIVRPGYGGYPLPNAANTAQVGTDSRRSSVASSHSDVSNSSAGSNWAGLQGGTADSDYDPAADPGRGSGPSRKAKPGRTENRKGHQARGGARKAAVVGRNQKPSQPPMYGHSVSGASPPNAGDKPAPTPAKSSAGTTTRSGATVGVGGSSANSSGVSHNGNLTVCEYNSPVTGLRCGTEFHRPYDLARHRETIHAKEEAMLLRQGKLTREQCRVLYVEVDPEKSQATQEWKCDGKNGCGSVFSRKDALQRHKRLRNH
ncbi:unnamed protein product [Parajaminaea phylloscopi]